MNKLRTLIILCCLQSLCIFAAERDSIYISQHVSDSFTRHGIPDVFITLADSNGVLIDTMRTRYIYNTNTALWSKTAAKKPQTFLVKAEHPDYETSVVRVEMKVRSRVSDFEFPELLMKRKMKETALNEVTVTATRVQLAYRGDTIVVDAQAFKIPEGSMLDALVAQIPSAELKEDGTIYMNGRKVDYLTLNGKDFFKGKNRVMLDNLPYYVVNKLKFYEKDVPTSQMKHRDTGEKDYVMDVEMKQEYSIGYTANVELGGGTDERWLARLFGLRFTDNSRLVLFGGANNINDIRQPGAEGWRDNSRTQTGEKAIKMLGGSLSIDDKHGRYAENVEATVSWGNDRDETRTSQETFLSQGSIFSRAQQVSRNNEFTTSLGNKLEFSKISLISETSANYMKQNTDGISRSATFLSDPSAYGSCKQILDSMFSSPVSAGLRGININKVLNQTRYQQTSLELGQEITWDKTLPWGDDLSFTLLGNYCKGKRDLFSRYDLTYADNNLAEIRQDRYSPNSHYNYSYGGNASYTFNFYNSWYFIIRYNYTHQYVETDNPLYRLDQIGSSLDFGILPSQMEYQQTIDVNNTYKNRNSTQIHNTCLAIKRTLNTKSHTLLYGVSANIMYKGENAEHLRSNMWHDIRRGYWLIEPMAYFQYRPNNKKRIDVRFNYDSKSSTPALEQMLDIQDTSDPLAITNGNPDLKRSMRHHFHLQVMRGRFGSACWLEADINILDNIVANGFTYNSTTGVYTYRPENVKGNWNSKTSVNFNRYLDSDKLLILRGKTAYDYIHNVDLTRVEGFTTSVQNQVSHHITSQNLTLSYNKGSLRLEAIGDFAWNVTKRELKNYNDIFAFDYSYGISGQYILPWKIQLSSDLKMYSRRGYEESSMNTDELVWNASVSRPFLKGKLIVKLDAIDILNQISNTRYVVNGQGRIETWQLCMPRYAMFRVAYKFNKNPKKR
jgi:hypothetical protein